MILCKSCKMWAAVEGEYCYICYKNRELFKACIIVLITMILLGIITVIYVSYKSKRIVLSSPQNVYYITNTEY
jgi:hypothetical protein